ncbi:MAG TPA: MFS transporter [Candidatus Dormibacteraeota bacterium]
MDRRATTMVLIHGAYTAANLLAATFLSIFLWRASHDLARVALFTWISAVTIPVAFLANGVFFKRAGAGTSIRVGLAMLGLTYLAVLGLGNASINWIVPLGLLRGLGEGWYWAGYHLTTYDTTTERDRDRYFGTMGAVNCLLSGGLPPLAGAAIVLGAQWGGMDRGYQVIFGLAGALLLGAILLAGRLRCGYRPTFSLRTMATLHLRNHAWQNVMGARLADGFSGMLSGVVLTVLAYMVLDNEQQVGNFNGIMGLLGVGISLVLAAYMKPRHRIACAMIGAALLVASTLVLPLYLSAWALVAFGLLRAVGGPMHSNGLAPLALQVIDRDPQARTVRFEYIVHQELCLAVGRVLSIGFFLVLAAPADQLLLARIVVVVAGAAPMVIWAAFARIAQPAAQPVMTTGEVDPRALPAAA